MKRILLALMLFAGTLSAQQNNATNTNFTNGLGASKFFNIPRGTVQPTTGVLVGSLFYHTALGLQYYNGSTWKTVGTEITIGNVIGLQDTLTNKYSKSDADARFVPYTGANKDVDLGLNSMVIGPAAPVSSWSDELGILTVSSKPGDESIQAIYGYAGSEYGDGIIGEAGGEGSGIVGVAQTGYSAVSAIAGDGYGVNGSSVGGVGGRFSSDDSVALEILGTNGSADLFQARNGPSQTLVASLSRTGSFTAASYIKSGGTSSQFLKADGSVDNTAYAPAGDLAGYATITGSNINLSAFRTALNVNNVDNTSDLNKPVSTATQTALDLKAPIASPTFTGTVSGITKAMVGLSNVDNTSDANKPVSTATQTALDTKQATLVSGTNIKTINGSSILGSGDLSTGGVTSLTGTADEIEVSASTGAVTLSLPATINANTTGTAGNSTLWDGNTYGGPYLPLAAGQFNKLTGGLYFTNNNFIYVRNAADTDNLRLFGLSNTDQLWLDPDGIGVNFGWSGNFTGNVTAQSFIKAGGVSSQFLKADGGASGLVEADVPALPISKTTGLQTALDSKSNTDGTNATGTWPIGITGNAATATSSAQWNGIPLDMSSTEANFSTFLGYDGSIPTARQYSISKVQAVLGITGGPFLPLTGGIITGDTYLQYLNPQLVLNNTSGNNWKLQSYSDGNFYIGRPGIFDAYKIDASGNNTWSGAGAFGGAISTTGQLPLLIPSTTFFDKISGGPSRFASVGSTAGSVGTMVFSQYSSGGEIGRDFYSVDASGNNIWTGSGTFGGALTVQNAKIGNATGFGDNFVRFGHKDFDGTSNYGFIQSNTGNTYIGGPLELANSLTGTSATFGGTVTSTVANNTNAFSANNANGRIIQIPWLTSVSGSYIGAQNLAGTVNQDLYLDGTNIKLLAPLTGTSATFGGNLATSGILKLGAVNGAFHSAGVNYFYSGGTSAVITNSTGTTDLVTVLEGGNVLIGTTTDNGTDKLQVNGSIRGTDIIANNQLIAGGNITGVAGNFSGTVTVATPTAGGHAINKTYGDATYAPIASPTFTGIVTAPVINVSELPTTSSVGTYSLLTRNTSTGMVEKVSESTYAKSASPAFTGTPTAPTPVSSDASTRIATTAFVQSGFTAQGQGIKVAATGGSITPHTLTNSDYYHEISISPGTVNLPSTTSNGGRMFVIKAAVSNAFTVSIVPNGSDTINGASSYTLTGQDVITILSLTGSNDWRIISKYTP